MTPTELLTRARQVWGSGKVSAIAVRPDGAADVYVRTAGAVSDVPEHRLDAAGVPTCHDACARTASWR